MALFFSSHNSFCFQDILWFHANVMISCSLSLKSSIGISMKIASNLYIALFYRIILDMLIVPIHEYKISYHFFLSSSLSLIMSYIFRCTGPSHSLHLLLGILCFCCCCNGKRNFFYFCILKFHC